MYFDERKARTVTEVTHAPDDLSGRGDAGDDVHTGARIRRVHARETHIVSTAHDQHVESPFAALNALPTVHAPSSEALTLHSVAHGELIRGAATFRQASSTRISTRARPPCRWSTVPPTAHTRSSLPPTPYNAADAVPCLGEPTTDQWIPSQ